jgi:hypothetical protein
MSSNAEDLERQNWELRRKVSELESREAGRREAAKVNRRIDSARYAEIETLKRQHKELIEDLYQSNKERDALRELVEVLKRANEINEKQIRDYERDYADVPRPPKADPVPYTGTIYGIAMR